MILNKNYLKLILKCVKNLVNIITQPVILHTYPQVHSTPTNEVLEYIGITLSFCLSVCTGWCPACLWFLTLIYHIWHMVVSAQDVSHMTLTFDLNLHDFLYGPYFLLTLILYNHETMCCKHSEPFFTLTFDRNIKIMFLP